MKCLRVWMIIFCLLGCVFISTPGYCLYRDDVDSKKIKEEVEKKRQENKYRFQDIQRQSYRLEKSDIKEQNLVPGESKEKKADGFKSKSGLVFVLLFAAGITGYIAYKYKRKNKT